MNCQICNDAESGHVVWFHLDERCPNAEGLDRVAGFMHMHTCDRHFHVHLCEDCYGTRLLDLDADDLDALAARFAHDHGPATGAAWN